MQQQRFHHLAPLGAWRCVCHITFRLLTCVTSHLDKMGWCFMQNLVHSAFVGMLKFGSMSSHVAMLSDLAILTQI